MKLRRVLRSMEATKMAVRPCSPNDSVVELDVEDGEYVRYEVSFQGATANFTIEDATTGSTVLDDDMGPGPGPFIKEWPALGEAVDFGTHLHGFSGIYLAAAEYRLKAVHCRANGTTKKVLKSCCWKVGVSRPLTALDIEVIEPSGGNS
jgi:hypothetical protein